MKEIWKDIKGYEGAYQVSNLGRIKSLSRYNAQNAFIKEKILRQGVKKGYLSVSLSKNRKAKQFYVHRLAAQAFIKDYDFINKIIQLIILNGVRPNIIIPTITGT